jgi:hypothetical protein
MAEPLRNEVSIQLGGEARTMRATFAALRGIERDLGMNIVPLLFKIGDADVGVNQAAVVIFHGLKGYGDTRLTLDEVGEAVLAEGLSNLMLPVTEFLKKALDGASLGKPAAAA